MNIYHNMLYILFYPDYLTRKPSQLTINFLRIWKLKNLITRLKIIMYRSIQYYVNSINLIHFINYVIYVRFLTVNLLVYY